MKRIFYTPLRNIEKIEVVKIRSMKEWERKSQKWGKYEDRSSENA